MNSREQVGFQVRRLRVKRGLRQHQLADFAQRTERWLRNVEQGRTAVTFEDVEKLSLGLRVDLQTMLGLASLKEGRFDQRRISGIPRVHGDQIEDDEVNRRGFLRAGLATSALLCGPLGRLDPELLEWVSRDQPRRPDTAIVNNFAAVTQLLASQRQSAGPDALLSPLEAHRDQVATLFQRATSSSVQRALGVLLGETSIVASRLWSAVGNRSIALANCADARRLADNLNEPALGATARLFEGNLHSDASTLIGADGDILLGLRMLTEAAALGHHLSPAARARIAAEQAQAFAVLHLSAESQHALDQARKAVDEIDGADRVGLFSDWNPARLQVYEGTCWLFLGEPKTAVDALNKALTAMDQGNLNVALAARVDLASAYAAVGELEEGCRLLGNAYADLADVGNIRGVERARRARARLQLWEQERSVRELDQRIEEITRG